MEAVRGHSLAELSSRTRSADQTRGRVEFTTLAAGGYGLRVCDVAALLRRHPNSVTNWLNRGLRLEHDDPGFKKRLDQLDAAISRRGQRTDKCGNVYVVPIRFRVVNPNKARR
jgi:hypothetical protein